MTAELHTLRTEVSEAVIDFAEEISTAQGYMEWLATHNTPKWLLFKRSMEWLDSVKAYEPRLLEVYLNNIGYTGRQAQYILRNEEFAYVRLVIAYYEIDGLTKWIQKNID